MTTPTCCAKARALLAEALAFTAGYELDGLIRAFLSEPNEATNIKARVLIERAKWQLRDDALVLLDDITNFLSEAPEAGGEIPQDVAEEDKCQK